MRPTDRLFEIVQLFRHGRLVKAKEIADAVGCSLRTVYRDVDRLIATGIPIEGERGVGYILREPIFLPPLTLKPIELEALHFGMEVVRRSADDELASAAETLLSKIDAVLPSDRPRRGYSFGHAVYIEPRKTAERALLPKIRAALRDSQKLDIAYLDLDDKRSRRVIRPLQIEFWGKVWTLTAWCELRADFRVFRIDRISSIVPTLASFVPEAGKRLIDFQKRQAGAMP
jgi:predicted DNA-binding transcriptional regulator YafY